MRSFGRRCLLAGLLCLFAAAMPAAQSNVEELYREATRRDGLLRKEIDAREAGAPADGLLTRARTLAQTYEDIARLFPRSGYSDNALWQGAVLAADAFWQFGDIRDRATALRLFARLTTEFPTSSLVAQVQGQTTRLNATANASAYSTLKAIRREVLPDAVRITLDIEREALFHE